MQAFEERGVEHSDITELPFGIAVLPFKDPDGVALELTARCARPSRNRGHHRIEGHTGHRCPMMRRFSGAELERPSDYETDARRRPGRRQTDLACSGWMLRRSGRVTAVCASWTRPPRLRCPGTPQASVGPSTQGVNMSVGLDLTLIGD